MKSKFLFNLKKSVKSCFFTTSWLLFIYLIIICALNIKLDASGVLFLWICGFAIGFILEEITKTLRLGKQG